MQSRPGAIKYWLPALAWMTLIFAGSTNLLSSASTSPFIVAILHRLKPDLSDHALNLAIEVIRKCGHLSEYAVLAVLTFAAVQGSFRLLKTPWSWRRAAGALAVCAAYAATDEFHQSFVPTRTSSGWDVLIDTGGAFVALALIGMLSRRHRAKNLSSDDAPARGRAGGGAVRLICEGEA
jgi:VanZ family protein